MTRLILRLFGIKDFEVCKSCETLKQQLEYERSEKARLTDTLIAIITPKVNIEPATPELNPVRISAGVFSKRRAALEEKDRQEARIIKEAKHIAKPDDSLKDLTEIESLEKELNISEEREA